MEQAPATTSAIPRGLTARMFQMEHSPPTPAPYARRSAGSPASSGSRREPRVKILIKIDQGPATTSAIPRILRVRMFKIDQPPRRYVRLSVAERREAARLLTAEGLPQRKVAGILGVSHETVRRDGGTNVPAGNAGRTDLAAFERMAGTNAPPSVARGRAAAEAQRKVAEMRLRAERKAGELLQAMEKNKGAQGNPGGRGAPVVRSPHATAQKSSIRPRDRQDPVLALAAARRPSMAAKSPAALAGARERGPAQTTGARLSRIQRPPQRTGGRAGTAGEIRRLCPLAGSPRRAAAGPHHTRREKIPSGGRRCARAAPP